MPDNVIGALPPAPKIVREVIRVTTSEAKTFICFSRSVWGQYVHWHANRSHECTQSKEKYCEGCERGWPVKWKGYLHVRDLTGTIKGFLEITDTAYRLIDHQLGTDKNLRGIRFRLARTKGGAKGRYIVEVYQDRLPEDQLIQEEDPYKTLKFLWSCKRPAGQSR